MKSTNFETYLLKYSTYYKKAVLMNYLTKLEEILLLTIWRLSAEGGSGANRLSSLQAGGKNNAYGVTIRKRYNEVIGGNLSFGALYVTLDKLVRKGYVTKTAGDPKPERGGRRKNFYQLTQEGSRALQNSRELNIALWNEVPEFAFKTK